MEENEGDPCETRTRNSDVMKRNTSRFAKALVFMVSCFVAADIFRSIPRPDCMVTRAQVAAGGRKRKEADSCETRTRSSEAMKRNTSSFAKALVFIMSFSVAADMFRSVPRPDCVVTRAQVARVAHARGHSEGAPVGPRSSADFQQLARGIQVRVMLSLCFILDMAFLALTFPKYKVISSLPRQIRADSVTKGEQFVCCKSLE